jgi:glyoxylase-like metal-dependent hydrolase (beta-lactamase superfamily II)
MMREAKTAKVNVIPLGSNLFVIENTGGNITVLDGPDGKMMVDAGISGSHPQIIAALDGISAHPLKEVINTHWHFDHSGGNPWLHEAGARITAHENTKKHMAVATPVTPWKYTFPPTPAPGLPTRLLNAGTAFSMNGTHIQVTHPEHAHTDGDLVVTFKEADVLVAADTFWNGYYPFIDREAGGTIDGMIRATEANLTVAGEKTKIVPGHGPIATKRELQEYHAMLVSVRASVAKLKGGGATVEQAVAAKPTASFDARWGHYAVDPDDFVRLVY